MQGYFLWQNFDQNRKILQTKDELKVLVSSSIYVFKSENIAVSAESFWRSVGKTKLDPWGKEYKLSFKQKNGEKLYFWQSAGPDGLLDSEDDLRAFLIDEKAIKEEKGSVLLDSPTATRSKEAK